MNLEITEADLLAVARDKFSNDETFQLQTKCMALIRLLEVANSRITELEALGEE